MPPVRQNGYCAKTMSYTYLAIKLYLCMYCIRDVAKGAGQGAHPSLWISGPWNETVPRGPSARGGQKSWWSSNRNSHNSPKMFAESYQKSMSVIVLDECKLFHLFFFVYFVFCSMFKYI